MEGGGKVYIIVVDFRLQHVAPFLFLPDEMLTVSTLAHHKINIKIIMPCMLHVHIAGSH